MVRRKFKKKDIALGVFFTLIAISIFTFYLWHQAQSFKLGIETADLKNQVKIIKKEVDELEAKKSYLLSLYRVEIIAKKELLLKATKKEQIIYVESSQIQK